MMERDKIPIPGHLRGLDRDVDLYAWRAVIRRLKCHSSVKLVALVASDYGNKDGTRVHPGIERLSNVTELDDRTVKMALKTLRDHGLMHRTVEGSAYGRRGGIADEHVLTVPRDIAVLPLLPVDESNPEREAKRAAQREKDAARKRARQTPRRKALPTTGTQEQVISVPEQVISDTGTGDLSSRNPVSQITPPTEAPTDVPSHGATIPLASKRGHAAARPRDSSFANGSSDKGKDTFRAFEAERRSELMTEGEELSEEDEDFIVSTVGHDYVESIVGDLDAVEESTVDGMLGNGAHPKAIVNTLLKMRGESEADYRDAQAYLLDLPSDQMQTFMRTAENHIATHFPEATHRFRMIFAARLAQRQRKGVFS